MTQEREKELTNEFNKLFEDGKFRISADFRDNSNKIADYWLSIMKSEINKVLEGVENYISYKSKVSMGNFGAVEAIEIINKYKQ